MEMFCTIKMLLFLLPNPSHGIEPNQAKSKKVVVVKKTTSKEGLSFTCIAELYLHAKF